MLCRSRILPEHVTPSPENPLLQAHVNEPTVLVQAAFVSQLSVLAVHSSISRIQRRAIHYVRRTVIHSAEFIIFNLYIHSQL